MTENRGAGPPKQSLEAESLAPLTPGSPRAQAAAGLIGTLAKAARALTLYDAGNELVRQFVAEYRSKAEEATAAGQVDLEVRPFELLLGKEVVYREEDRERSLAFKLFRDGVRKMSFARGVSSDELFRLLQILAVRFVGVRQAEDDVVTLLRKSEFRSITFAAVEGYTSEDDPAEAGLRRGGGEPPQDWDTPFPRLPAPGPAPFAAIPEEALAALRAEEAPEALGQSGIRLAAELAAWAARGLIPAAEVAGFCAELRDFLVADNQLALLATLATLAERQPAGPLRDEILRALADARMLEVVLSALPPSGGELPAEAARLVPFVPATAVMDRMVTEQSPERRSALLSMVAARLPADADAVAAKLPSLEGEVVRALLGVLAQKASERADQVALALLAHPAPDLQLEGLRVLAQSSQRAPAGPLLKLLASPEERIRVAAAEALEHHGDTASARAVAEALTGRKSYSRAEAAALGRTLGALHAGAALRLFDGWLAQKKKLLGALRTSEHEELLRWAAVAGLGVIPGPEAEQRLEGAVRGSDEALRRHVHGTMARRRAEGRRHG